MTPQDYILRTFDNGTKKPFTINNEALNIVKMDRAAHGLPRTFTLLRQQVKTRLFCRTVKP